MWVTLTLGLGVTLLWIGTSIMLNFLYAMCTRVLGISPYLFELPFIIMRQLYVPEGLIALTSLLPNFVLAGLYFMYRLQENKTFKHWSGWNYFRTTFFPITTVPSKTVPSKMDEFITVYAVVPHGVFPVGVIFQFILNEAFDHVTVVVTSLMFWIPIVREFACMAGVKPANHLDIVTLLDEGKSILVCPEGLRSIIHYNEPDGIMKVLKGIHGKSKARNGFIQCAMASENHKRIQIVPVYVDGEHSMYNVYNGLSIIQWIQEKMQTNYR